MSQLSNYFRLFLNDLGHNLLKRLRKCQASFEILYNTIKFGFVLDSAQLIFCLNISIKYLTKLVTYEIVLAVLSFSLYIRQVLSKALFPIYI